MVTRLVHKSSQEPCAIILPHIIRLGLWRVPVFELTHFLTYTPHASSVDYTTTDPPPPQKKGPVSQQRHMFKLKSDIQSFAIFQCNQRIKIITQARWSWRCREPSSPWSPRGTPSPSPRQADKENNFRTIDLEDTKSFGRKSICQMWFGWII